MLISTEKNFIFIHVAKTGGQSLRAVLKPYCSRPRGGQWRRLIGHLPIREDNHARIGMHSTARWIRLKIPRDLFDGAFKFAFVRNPYDLAVSRYAFLRKKETHGRHRMTQRQSFGDFLRSEKWRSLLRAGDQTAMLFDSRGELLVDKVYRFENFAEAYDELMLRLEIDNAPPLPHRNASARKDYRSYYGPAERKLVEEIWARDIERFGYSF
ncbi:sulfotransferase family 2 domain-containing protein [Mesorhizobium sp. 10J20-29]